MFIKYQLYPRGFWHTDCAIDERGAIMKLVKNDGKTSLLECLSCGKKANYPVGGVGCIRVDEV